MATYTAVRSGPPNNPARQDTDTPEAAEAREAAAATFESWLDWLDEARDAIEQGGGDSQDLDSLLASVLNHVATETEAAVAAAEKRATEHARHVLRLAEDSNHRIATVLRQQREAREERTAESAALAERLDRITDAIAAVMRENGELKARLAAQETEIARATAMLEREIAKERSLRRLLDSRRNRPPGQKIASELARRYAQKTLENAAKGRTEAATKDEAA